MKKKDRGFRHVTSTAKLIIREALPIQCVEAVFVGAYLTADMSEVKIAHTCSGSRPPPEGCSQERAHHRIAILQTRGVTQIFCSWFAQSDSISSMKPRLHSTAV